MTDSDAYKPTFNNFLAFSHGYARRKPMCFHRCYALLTTWLAAVPGCWVTRIISGGCW